MLHFALPAKDDRIPITLLTAVQPLLCYLPYFALCYLARRHNTYVVRLLLLPLVVLCILTAAYRYTWTHPSLYVYNWGQCFFAFVAIGRAFDMSLSPRGMLKHGEATPGPRSALSDALDLAFTMRGLSYKFGQGAYIPPHTRPTASRRAFVLATLRSFTTHYLLLDIFESTIKLLPNGIGTIHGGSIFLPPYYAATPWARYGASTLIHILTGSALMAGFNMVYDLIVLIAVGLFNSPPLAWPPLMENPFAADSMHAFWGRRWHQLLRRPLVVLGGIPASWLTGDVGMLCGTFIASALFHECSMYAMDRGLDLGGFLFFAIQGPILILERVWRIVTRRRVHGWMGRLWVYLVMFGFGQPLTDSWHRRGLGGGMVIPPFFSPTRLFLVPLLQQFLNRHGTT